MAVFEVPSVISPTSDLAATYEMPFCSLSGFGLGYHGWAKVELRSVQVAGKMLPLLTK